MKRNSITSPRHNGIYDFTLLAHSLEHLFVDDTISSLYTLYASSNLRPHKISHPDASLVLQLGDFSLIFVLCSQYHDVFGVNYPNSS